MVFNNNLLLGAAGASAGYTIDQSIRFNDNDSAYLTRTPGSASNRKTWTISTWVKYSVDTASGSAIFGSGATSAEDTFAYITSGGAIDWIVRDSSTIRGRIVTNRLFRDPSAWYHLVFVLDTTSGTAGDRMRLWVNGSEETSFSTDTNPPVNTDSAINSTLAQYIGFSRGNGGDNLWDGYQAEIQLVDGTALNASSFGEYNADGVWVPKKYTNAAGYGTNGFYITGADSADLGADYSGNGNDFTSSGLAAADQRLDTPTLNKATLNGVNLYTSGSALSDGNLTVTNSGTTGYWHRSYATQSLSYKTYWEVHADNLGSLNMGVSSLRNPNGGINNPAGNYGAGIQNNEAFVTGSYASESSGSRTFPISTGNYVMFAFDPDRGALWAGTEGTWKDGTSSSASSATILAEIEGTGTSYALFTGIDADDAIPHIAQYSTSVATARFSSEDWEGTAPTGYEDLSTANLPDPTIADPSAYFQTTLYTGDGSSSHEINQTGNSTFEPSMVWIKSRSAATDHIIQDQVRGNFIIYPNKADAEGATGGGWVKSFDSDGFTTDVNGPINASGATFAAWQWKANGSGSSNTDGSVTSTVSNESTSNFSIVKYTGTGSGTSTVGHGLGVTPDMILLKHLDRSQNWRVFHTSEGVGETGFLNSTAAFSADPDRITAVSSTTFSAAANMNESADYIAYAFAEVDGFSKFGSYTGNGSTDGVFIYTGFRPAFLMYKVTSTTDSWEMYDTVRQTFNVHGTQLKANLSNAETNDVRVDILSNGFKARSSNTAINASGSTYIYMAFAESPFKTATAR